MSQQLPQNPELIFQTPSGQRITGTAIKTGNGDYVVEPGPDRGKVVIPVNPPPDQR